MEEDIEHLKDLKVELDNMSITGPTSEDRLNTHRKSLAILNILNELDRLQKENTLAKETIKNHCSDMDKVNNILAKLQKENEDWQRAYQEEKDTQFNMLINSKCGHCGKEKPLYCEKCYQELISKNAKLQKENEELISDNLEYQRTQDIFDKRTYRKKYLEERRKEEPNLLYPDADEIYQRYYKLKKENEELKETRIDPKEYGSMKIRLANSIPKSVIQDKIDVLEMEEHYDYIDNRKAISVLKELLNKEE